MYKWFIAGSVAAQAQRYRFMSCLITRLTVGVGLFITEQDQGYLGRGRGSLNRVCCSIGTG